jgi:hypothetical protein
MKNEDDKEQRAEGDICPKKKGVTGDWRKQQSEELRKACSTNGQNKILIHSVRQ